MFSTMSTSWLIDIISELPRLIGKSTSLPMIYVVPNSSRRVPAQIETVRSGLASIEVR
jgi:hypothetical protein